MSTDVVYNWHMNDNEKALLELIMISQSGGDPSAVSCDWDEVYKEARIQSVLGLIAPLVPSPDAKWQEASYRQTAGYVRYNLAESSLSDVMAGAGIPFVVLKGNAASISYRDPALRSMGDIDLLVPLDLFEKARETLLSSGYEYAGDPEHNPRHIAFVKSGTELELHRHFSYEGIELESYVNAGFDARVTGNIGGHSFPMLPVLPNGLVLLAHMAQHLKGGLGLRQVIDWMVYVDKHLDDEAWASGFGAAARSIGLEKLALTATRMCQMYLGLRSDITWCSCADESLCLSLLENVVTSGNFGRKRGSGNKIESVRTSMKSIGILKRLQISGEHNWVLYKKHHWLRPFCWIYQAFRYLRQGLKARRGGDLKTDLKRGSERYELLRKLEIS